jgi:hypothetical protein
VPKITGAKMSGNRSGEVVVCTGCGANLEALDRGEAEHRPDCTVEPSPLICEDCDAIRLPSESKSPAWRYDPRTRTYHCPTQTASCPACSAGTCTYHAPYAQGHRVRVIGGLGAKYVGREGEVSNVGAGEASDWLELILDPTGDESAGPVVSVEREHVEFVG